MGVWGQHHAPGMQGTCIKVPRPVAWKVCHSVSHIAVYLPGFEGFLKGSEEVKLRGGWAVAACRVTEHFPSHDMLLVLHSFSRLNADIPSYHSASPQTQLQQKPKEFFADKHWFMQQWVAYLNSCSGYTTHPIPRTESVFEHVSGLCAWQMDSFGFGYFFLDRSK
jgi:hypothetical protein